MEVKKEVKRKRRALTIKNVLDIKPSKIFQIGNDELSSLIGKEPQPGLWLIYGSEKHGKTSFALQLTKALAQFEKVVYVSAEEGVKSTFVQSLDRSGLTESDTNILIEPEYISIDEIIEYYKSPRKANVIIIDNLTIYEDEFKKPELNRLKKELSHKLVIFLAHEERKIPFPAIARQVRKLADVYVRVVGLNAYTTSRYDGGGGEYVISNNAEYLHGSNILE